MEPRPNSENISKPQIKLNTSTIDLIDLNNKTLPLLIVATTLYLDY